MTYATRIGRLLGAGTVLALIVGIMLEVTTSASPISHAAQGPTHPYPPYLSAAIINRPVIQYPPGVPGIVPTASRSATDPAQPTYTVEDMRGFVLANLPQTVDNTPARIARIAFMPASQTSALLSGEWIGRPPTEPVCVVEIHGNFSRAGETAPPGSVSAAGAVTHVIWWVFDAYTGNLLLVGA